MLLECWPCSLFFTHQHKIVETRYGDEKEQKGNEEKHRRIETRNKTLFKPVMGEKKQQVMKLSKEMVVQNGKKV